jgi:hypothetical protein
VLTLLGPAPAQGFLPSPRPQSLRLLPPKRGPLAEALGLAKLAGAENLGAGLGALARIQQRVGSGIAERLAGARTS